MTINVVIFNFCFCLSQLFISRRLGQPTTNPINHDILLIQQNFSFPRLNLTDRERVRTSGMGNWFSWKSLHQMGRSNGCSSQHWRPLGYVQARRCSWSCCKWLFLFDFLLFFFSSSFCRFLRLNLSDLINNGGVLVIYSCRFQSEEGLWLISWFLGFSLWFKQLAFFVVLIRIFWEIFRGFSCKSTICGTWTCIFIMNKTPLHFSLSDICFVIGDRLMPAMGITVRITLQTRGTNPKCGQRTGLAGKSYNH